MATTFTLQSLADELANDPIALGYSTSPDSEAADKINDASVGREVDRRSVDPNEILDSIDPTEFGSLAADDLAGLQLMLNRNQVNIIGTNIRGILVGIFSGAQFAATRSNLVAIQTSPGSRAAELWG